MNVDTGWRAEEIPAGQRTHLYVDGDGYLNYRFKADVTWVRPRDARQQVMEALNIEGPAAVEAMRLRLISGQIIASAGVVLGPISKREHLKINGDRAFLSPEL